MNQLTVNTFGGNRSEGYRVGGQVNLWNLIV